MKNKTKLRGSGTHRAKSRLAVLQFPSLHQILMCHECSFQTPLTPKTALDSVFHQEGGEYENDELCFALFVEGQ